MHEAIPACTLVPFVVYAFSHQLHRPPPYVNVPLNRNFCTKEALWLAGSF